MRPVVVAYLDKSWSTATIDGYAQHPESVALLCNAFAATGRPTTALDVGAGPAIVEAAAATGCVIVNYVEKVAVPGQVPWLVPDHVDPRSYAGPSATALRATTDKARTKRLLADYAVPTPPAVLATAATPDVLAAVARLTFPVLLKPNAEAGSVGITDASVAETPDAVYHALDRHLAEFPAGVLVEEYIDGHDVTISLLEDAEGFRCLPAVKYLPRRLQETRFGMYDYTAKNDPRHVLAQARMDHAECPAHLDVELLATLERHAVTAATATGLRGFARADFRVTAAGAPTFLEINSLPDIDPTAGFSMALRMEALDVSAVVTSLENAYPALRG